MTKHDFEVLVASSTDNFGYLTGYFTHYGKNFDIGWIGDPCLSIAAIPLEKDVEPFLLTTWQNEDVEYIDTWIKDRRFHRPLEYGVEDRGDFFKVLSDIIKEKRLDKSKIGFELGYESFTTEIASEMMVRRLRKFLPHTKFRNSSALLREMRLIKTKEEMDRIIKSSKITEKAIKTSFEQVMAGMTETELEWIIRRNLLEDKVDVALININFGENDLLRPTERKLEEGDFIRIDLASKYEQYYGDVARTVIFGAPSTKLQKAYNAIQKAHDATIDAIELNIKCSEIFNTTKDSLKESGYSYESPLVGHGIGICVHEGPYLGDNDMVIQPGMAFTVEILENFGKSSWAGMEDNVVCDRDGCQDITTLPKDLLRI